MRRVTPQLPRGRSTTRPPSRWAAPCTCSAARTRCRATRSCASARATPPRQLGGAPAQPAVGHRGGRRRRHRVHRRRLRRHQGQRPHPRVAAGRHGARRSRGCPTRCATRRWRRSAGRSTSRAAPPATRPRATCSRSTRAAHAVTKASRLPHGMTHAAAAAFGCCVYVIGGRGIQPGTPTRRIFAFDPCHRHLQRSRPAAGRPVGPRRRDAAAPHPRVRRPRRHGDGSTDRRAAATDVRRALACLSLAALAVVPPAATDGRRRPSRPAKAVVFKPPRDGAPGALPGMPPLLDPARRLRGRPARPDRRGRARTARPLVYVPNSESNTVDRDRPAHVQDRAPLRHRPLPQHVVPSWDLKTLWVANDYGNSLTAIDPTHRRPRPHHPGGRSLQHVLHARRPLRDRRGGAPRPRSTSATRTRCACIARCRCHARASTTWTSPPTAATRSRAASSPARWWSSTWRASAWWTGSCCAPPRCRRT